MRHFVFLLSTVILASIGQGCGTSRMPDAKYDKDAFKQYEPYVGTYAGSKGSDSLVVMLEKNENYFRSLDFSIPHLIGRYYLFENGKLDSAEYDLERPTLTEGLLENDSYLIFNFFDLKKRKSGRARLIFRDSALTVAQWELRMSPGVYLIRPDRSFSVPKDIMLRKIN